MTTYSTRRAPLASLERLEEPCCPKDKSAQPRFARGQTGATVVNCRAMPDSLAARYDATPYRHGAIQHSHPARMGAIGRLHGLLTAPPDRCRVLELGCAEGANLLPLAERF